MGVVSSLLDSKGYDVLTVQPDQPVRDAIGKMDELSAGSALVMDQGEVVGILSERDVFREILLKDKGMAGVCVKDIMSRELTTVTPDTSLDECMQLMTEKRVRHLPVLRDKQLSGIISIGDVVKYLVVEKDFKIKNLETYISGIKE